MELDYKAIGKRIKIQRIQREMTQEKLAELTGLSNPHISNVETGSTQVSLKSLIAIANALEITPDVLLCDNIRYGKHIFKNAVMEAVDDCDEVEIRIMADMVQALKRSIRYRKKYFKEQECSLYL